MSERTGYVAFDLGAESGRAMLAIVGDGRIELQEAHRFANLPQHLPSGYHWNLQGLWAHLLEGLHKAARLAAQSSVELVSLGVDTWGVDFGLIGDSGQLLGLPFAYRDQRNPPAMQKAFDTVGAEAIYKATGIQFMPFNTLYQLIAQQDAEPGVLGLTRRMLNVPDLLHYFFSGEQVNEATIASTTQMIDPRTGNWATGLMEQLGLSTHFLPDQPVPAGTKIGQLREELARDAGVEPLSVIVPGSHDTASAVAAVPLAKGEARPWAYLSSGTWSLMGAELDEPIVSEAARQASFTNERGVADKIRFLKNIAGLWLVQEVRRDLDKAGETYDYPTLTDMARQAEPFRTLIDTAHAPFASPGDIRSKIDAFAAATGQPAPQTPGQYVRCCLESLALTYATTLQALDELLGRPTEVLHIVGGGGKNELLNQMTADAINRPVVVGPYEATAIGNALTQAIGHGQLADLAELRAVVRNSFELSTYEPTGAAAFAAQRQRFTDLAGR